MSNHDSLLLLAIIDPVILPHQQVDKGAIKFLLSGANVMCRGLTSPGAKLADLPKGAVVVSFIHCDQTVVQGHWSDFEQENSRRFFLT